MISRGPAPVWSPIESLDDVDVILVERDGQAKVEIVDKRVHNVLVSLSPDDMLWWAIELASKAQEGPRELDGVDVERQLSGPG